MADNAQPQDSSEKPRKGPDKGADSTPEKKELNEAKEGDESVEKKPKKKFHWTALKVIVLLAIAAALIVLGTQFYLYSSTHPYTDDAYTTGHIHNISSRVDDTVLAVLVDDNYEVKEGQILIQLDPRDFQVKVDKAQADYDKAVFDYKRVFALRNDIAISKQDFDQTNDTLETAKSALDDAKDQLSYCTIRSPADGYIGRKQVEVGDRVTVGGALMAVVQDVWVVANFKETQIAKMKLDQPVQVTVDAIPGVTFQAKIDSFSPGTGSVFALLPPDNATGNFTKIVQRVPVKITFDPESVKNFRGRLLPGLSVIPTVLLKDQNPPQPEGPEKFGL